jgi:hypothetical protein
VKSLYIGVLEIRFEINLIKICTFELDRELVFPVTMFLKLYNFFFKTEFCSPVNVLRLASIIIIIIIVIIIFLVSVDLARLPINKVALNLPSFSQKLPLCGIFFIN